MTTPNSLSCHVTQALRACITGDVFVPGEHGYDHARQAWNLFADQQPTAVVFAESAADVARAVKFAAAQGVPRRRAGDHGTGRRWHRRPDRLGGHTTSAPAPVP